MKILVYGLSNNLGGIEKYIYNIYTNLSDSYEVDYLISDDKVCFEKEFEKRGSKFVPLKYNRKTNILKHWKELFSIFNKKSYDIIHFHLMSPLYIDPILIAKLTRNKVIIHAHGNYSTKSFFKKTILYINRLLLNLIKTKNLACSVDAGNSFFLNKKYEVAYNSIAVPEYKYKDEHKKELNDKLDVAQKKVIGHIGRFEKEKNQMFLIEILNELVKVRSDIVLVLIGNGSMRQEIEKKAKSMNLNEFVVFLDPILDVYKYYSLFDLFIFPSKSEGLGLVLVEAQASGLISVISDKVPKEAILTDIVKVMLLEDGAKAWSSQILKELDRDINRKKYNNIVMNTDYELNKAVIKIENMYTDLKKGDFHE